MRRPLFRVEGQNVRGPRVLAKTRSRRAVRALREPTYGNGGPGADLVTIPGPLLTVAWGQRERASAARVGSGEGAWMCVLACDECACAYAGVIPIPMLTALQYTGVRPTQESPALPSPAPWVFQRASPPSVVFPACSQRLPKGLSRHTFHPRSLDAPAPMRVILLHARASCSGLVSASIRFSTSCSTEAPRNPAEKLPSNTTATDAEMQAVEATMSARVLVETLTARRRRRRTHPSFAYRCAMCWRSSHLPGGRAGTFPYPCMALLRS
jgi:hypothetical protein